VSLTPEEGRVVERFSELIYAEVMEGMKRALARLVVEMPDAGRLPPGWRAGVYVQTLRFHADRMMELMQRAMSGEDLTKGLEESESAMNVMRDLEQLVQLYKLGEGNN